MRRVFIADAHLRNPTDENYRHLLRFFSELKGSTESLFILGDLFEFWVGYQEAVFPHYYPVLRGLQELQDAGTEIVYFEGNHDFHLGRFFTETLHASIYPGPAILTLDGRRIYVCHGDQINSSDHGYLMLRRLLRSRAIRILFPLIPSAIVARIAKHLSRRSKRKHGERNTKWNFEALLSNFAELRFRDSCDAVITAHYHYPLLSTSKNGRDKTLLSIGDWITQYSYGEMIEGKLSLHRYR
jgi:UDP-2,3-diacylglucosamine hydrolase